MSGLDRAVARSRLGGSAAGERKSFTLARSRAIRKMREFALADPHYYVLELIQAAVAQGATYVKISLEQDSFALSCTGACFREEELAQLFDFLFAGKDRPDLGHVRELALGVNALLLFKPSEVMIESGDGSLEGSTRLLLTRSAEEVQVGRASEPILGTIVKAKGLHRGPLRRKSALMELPGLPLEASAIEERCLTAPVPIVMNDRPVFGYSADKLPKLPGYARYTTFDEGDLYGCIGVGPQGFPGSFKLLTFGVWIESVERNPQLGGIICFDRLHKTADHSGIVQDHLWEELWARLRPYVEQLTKGTAKEIAGAVMLLSGEALTVRELRPLLRAYERICLVPPGTAAPSVSGRSARAIGEALDCPVLRISDDERPWLRALAGPGTSFLSLDLSGDADLPFYSRQPLLEPPPRPWLTGETALGDLSLDELVEDIRRRLLLVDMPGALKALLGLGLVRLRVYSPVEPPAPDRLTVRLGTVDRMAQELSFASPYPGLVLHAFLPDMPPRVLSAELRAGSEPTRPVGTLLAWELAGRASQALAESSRLALERSSGELGPAARSLALAALGRNMAAHLTTGPGGRPQVAFLVMGEGFTDSLLSLPLFATLGGDSVSMEELASRIERNHGLAYGVIPEVPPALDGLDQQEILSLDEATESRLLGLVGDSVYVRVDRREVLAEHRGLLCRDLALGLRPYPSFPLLVEGVDPSTWPHEEQSAALGILLDQLVRCVTGLATSCGPERHPVGEEERRQACRHLQWFVCKRALAIRAGEQIPGFGVERLPLFLDPEDRAWSFYEVERALQRPEGLTLSLRRALGASELGLLVAAASDLEAAKDQDPSSAPSSLTVSPFVASLLAPLGSLRYALDHPLPGAATSRPGPGSNPGLDRAPEARYLCQLEVRGNGFSGQAGIPAEPSIKGEVSLIEGKSDRLHALPELSTSFGMIALVRLDSAGPMDGISLAQVEMSLRKTGEGLMDGLLELLPDLHPDGPDHLSAALRLLSFAAGQLQLVAAPDGQVRFSSPLGLPARVLDLPLFPGTSGVLLSARSLLERFCRSGGDAPPLDLVAKEAPEALRAWIGRFLQPARVLRLASARPPVVPSDQPRAEHPEDALLAVSVERWLHALRPDLDTPDSMGAKVAQFRVVARRSEVFSRFTNPRELISYTSFDRQPTLILNGDHWLFAHARERGGADPRALAALLLGCYAHVNAALDPISNEHERIFQRRLIEALESGALGAEAGPEPPRDAPEEAPWQ